MERWSENCILTSSIHEAVVQPRVELKERKGGREGGEGQRGEGQMKVKIPTNKQMG